MERRTERVTSGEWFEARRLVEAGWSARSRGLRADIGEAVDIGEAADV
jgi:hypothetical protein